MVFTFSVRILQKSIFFVTIFTFFVHSKLGGWLRHFRKQIYLSQSLNSSNCWKLILQILIKYLFVPLNRFVVPLNRPGVPVLPALSVLLVNRRLFVHFHHLQFWFRHHCQYFPVKSIIFSHLQHQHCLDAIEILHLLE